MVIKFQEKGYGQGFYDGQMKERKYWQIIIDKDKLIEELKKYKK